MFDENVNFLTRILRKAGVPPSDLDDAVQRTFIVAAGRLDDVRDGSERSFLYQVALNVAAHVRRSMARRREVIDDKISEPIGPIATPEQLTGGKEMRQLLDEVAVQLDERLYLVFKLLAYEEAGLPEIAKRLGLPRGTVASRLRRVREHFRKHAAVFERASTPVVNDAQQVDAPRMMTGANISELTRVLLAAGVFPRATRSMRAGALTALGIADGQTQSSRTPTTTSQRRRPSRRRSDIEQKLDARNAALSR